MMELIKKVVEIIKNLYRNIWFRTILFISVFLSFYAIRKMVNITNNTLTMLNLVLMAVFFVQLYQRLNEKKVSIVRFLFILVLAFILNEFYNSDIFFRIFKIRLNYAVILMGSVIFLYIIGSKVVLFIKKRKKEQSKLKKDSVQKEVQHNDVPFEETNYYDSIEGDTPNTNIVIDKQPEINIKKSEKSQTGVIILICFIILLFSALSIIPLFNKNMRDILGSLETSNGLSIYISLIGLLFLCIFMWAVVVTVFIRLAQIILNIIKNKDLQSNYLLNASAFLIVSYFITKQYNISLDNILDSIIQGNILSFPILILILLPLFFALLQNLETLIKKNKEIKEKTVELISELIFRELRFE